MGARFGSRAIVLVITAALATACAPGVEEDESVGAAQTVDPTYASAASGTPHIAKDTRRTARQSASTRVVQFVDGQRPDAVVEAALAVRRWTEIRDEEGKAVFSAAKVVADEGTADGRTIRAKVTLDDVALDVEGGAQVDGDGFRVSFTNTSAYEHWLLGTVLAPNGLTIEAKIVPFRGGTIVDGTMLVKLEKREGEAEALTAAIVSFVQWLADKR